MLANQIWQQIKDSIHGQVRLLTMCNKSDHLGIEKYDTPHSKNETEIQGDLWIDEWKAATIYDFFKKLSKIRRRRRKHPWYSKAHIWKPSINMTLDGERLNKDFHFGPLHSLPELLVGAIMTNEARMISVCHYNRKRRSKVLYIHRGHDLITPHTHTHS